MNEAVTILYTNWKGETSERDIKPIELWFGATEYHPEEQWLLRALDIEKNDERNFAMKDIQRWETQNEAHKG
jgi:predicted DNA-binding transcriptional regulator YafY